MGDPRAEARPALDTLGAYLDVGPLAARRSRRARHQPVAHGSHRVRPARYGEPPRGARSRRRRHDAARAGAARARGQALRPTRRRQRRRHLRATRADGRATSASPSTSSPVPDGCSMRLHAVRVHVPRARADRCRPGGVMMRTRKPRRKPCPYCGSRDTSHILWGLYAPIPSVPCRTMSCSAGAASNPDGRNVSATTAVAATTSATRR